VTRTLIVTTTYNEQANLEALTMVWRIRLDVPPRAG
jgi:hypothetical protein